MYLGSGNLKHTEKLVAKLQKQILYVKILLILLLDLFHHPPQVPPPDNYSRSASLHSAHTRTIVCTACLRPYAVQARGPALPVTATSMGSKVFSCRTRTQYSGTMAFPVPAISPAWSLFCQPALIQHKSFTHKHTLTHTAAYSNTHVWQRLAHTEAIRLPPRRQKQATQKALPCIR